MGKLILCLAVGLTVLGVDAWLTYRPKPYKNMQTYTPTTVDEVKKYLCMNMKKGKCEDHIPAKIILNKVFDFTTTENQKQEVGCYHRTDKGCRTIGQLKLNVVNQCSGLTPTNVSYSVAGRYGLDVGSNKIIFGQNGGGLKGKGLRLYKSHNVEIRNISIIDINAQVIWGGDAIDLIDVKNVLIDGNYIKNIGRQMIVTHFGSNRGVTISNNVFDGNTPYSSMCDGTHYWLWLFLGEGDMITLQNNVIFHTSGRGPHLVAAKNSKTLLHMIQNTFYDVTHLIELDDTKSSILVEGNVFVNVKEVIHCNRGNIFMTQNVMDQKACEIPLGRQCLLNTFVNSGGTTLKNSLTVLEDFKKFKSYIAAPIVMANSITKWITLPQSVKQCIK